MRTQFQVGERCTQGRLLTLGKVSWRKVTFQFSSKQRICEGAVVYFIINGKSKKCFEKLTEMISGGI